MKQAKLYKEKAIKLGGRFVQEHGMIETTQVLFMKRLLTSYCAKDWEEVAERSSTVNLWEHHMQVCKAKRAFAAHMGLNLDAVQIEAIEKTPEGIAGWADIQPMAMVRAGPKSGPAKAKPKAKPKTGPTDSVPAAERELKKLLAKEMEVKEDMKSFQEKMDKVMAAGDSSTSTAWAELDRKAIDEFMQELVVFRDGSEFLKSFERAVLSPDALRKIKKESGTDYFSNLVHVQRFMGSALGKASDLIVKLNNMAMAAHPEFEVAGTPSKKQRKGARSK